ncbi:hypothetical protein Tco_0157365, partial [Tanacetum coccineum]
RTVGKVPDTKDMIKFMLDTEKLTYIVDMFRDTLHLPVETPENPFVTLVNIQTTKASMNRVGYQVVVDKVSAFYTKNLAQPWQTMFKVFNHCLTTRTSVHDQTKINILQLFHAVINRTNVDYAALLWIDEDYHYIKDDIPLEIRATDDFKEYETVFMNVDVLMNQPQPVVSTQGTHRTTPRAHKTPTLTAASPQGKKRKQSVEETSSLKKSLKITIRQKQVDESEKDKQSYDDTDDSDDRSEPEIHKENPEHVDDDDEEKVDEKKYDEMGSLEIRAEEMQTPIPTTPRSPRTILSSDKNITQELTDTVSPPTATTSKNPHFKRRISSKYSHLSGVLRRMCRRQGYMIKNMERKCVTTKYFWKTHKKVDRVLHEIVPQLAERAIYDLTENNLKPSIAATIIKYRDAFRSEVHDIVSQEFNAQAPKIIEELFKNYVQNNVIQVHPTTTTSTKTTSSAGLQQQLDDDIHSQRHDDHQEDDAPPEGEKRVKRHKTSNSSKSAREETVIDEDEVISKDETPELIIEFQNVDKPVPTIFDRARMEATLNDMLSNQFKNAEEYAYHFYGESNSLEKQTRGHKTSKVVKITIDQPYGLDFMEQIFVMRENDKPDSFSEADFKYLNKNDIEDLYYLCRNKKLGIESYQVKVNLTAPTLTFPSIEAYELYSIVDKPNTGLIYLNNKNEKRVMYLVEIVKFCDATLEKVLKEVKLKIFQSKS